jgi:formylglycine-generating enzyme required for sulfatase activity
MHGNVWQWCADDCFEKERTILAARMVGMLGGPFGQGPFLAASDLSRPGQVVPLGGSARVFRSGSWFNYGTHCQTAVRDGLAPTVRNFDLGFRLARVPVR